jgi:hypothetical protein
MFLEESLQKPIVACEVLRRVGDYNLSLYGSSMQFLRLEGLACSSAIATFFDGGLCRQKIERKTISSDR